MKWIIALLVAAGIYSTASFYTGTQVESRLDQLIDNEADAIGAAGYTVDVKNFQRGIFSSTADVSLTHPLFLSIGGKMRIYHGPVLFKGGLSLGAFSAVTQIESLNILDEDYSENAYLKTLESITQVGFTQRVKQWIHFPAFDGELSAGQTLQFAGGNSRVLSQSDLDRGDFSFELGALQLQMDDGMVFSMEPASASGSYYSLAPGVLLQKFSAQFPGFKLVAGNINQDFAVRDLKLSGDYAIEGSDVNNNLAITIGAVDGAYPIKDFSLLVDIMAMPVSSYSLLATLSSEVPDETVAPQIRQTKILQAINAMMDKSNLKVRLDATILDAPVAMDYQVRLARPLTLDEVAQDFTNSTYTQAVRIDANVSLGKKIIETTPLGMVLMMGGKADMLIPEGDNFVSRISIDQGVMTVNGVLHETVDAAASEMQDDAHAEHDHSDPNHTH